MSEIRMTGPEHEPIEPQWRDWRESDVIGAITEARAEKDYCKVNMSRYLE